MGIQPSHKKEISLARPPATPLDHRPMVSTSEKTEAEKNTERNRVDELVTIYLLSRIGLGVYIEDIWEAPSNPDFWYARIREGKTDRLVAVLSIDMVHETVERHVNPLFAFFRKHFSHLTTRN